MDGAGVVLLGTGTSLEPQSKSPVALTKVKSIALPRNAFMSLFASPNRKYRYRQRRNSTNGKNRTAHLVSNHIRGQISYSRRRNSSKGKRSTVMFRRRTIISFNFQDGSISSYSKTPLHSGSQTPLYKETGNKTPMCDSTLLIIRRVRLIYLFSLRWFSYSVTLRLDDAVTRWFEDSECIVRMGSGG